MPKEHEVYTSGEAHVTNFRAVLGDRILGFVGGLLVGRSQKNSYLVHFGDALGSQDEAQIQEADQALKEAIIEQG